MSSSPVLFEVQDHIGLITLNRAESRNNMTEEMLNAFTAAAARAKADHTLRALVITGTGANFCGGADLTQPIQMQGHALPNEASFAMYKPFLSLLQIEVPIIGAMQGHAIGGGLGLALVCDLRVANQQAKYGANFVKLGLHPGMATTYLLPRLVGVTKANELLLTGRLINGAEALQIGLVNEAVEQSAVLPRALALAEEIAQAAPIAVRWTKRSIYRFLQWEPEDAAEYEAHLQSRTLESADHREGITAFLEKRKGDFKNQ